MSNPHDLAFAPEPKRRSPLDSCNENAYCLYPSQNKLSTISSDCLVEILTHVGNDSIALLLRSGDTMLYDKMTYGIGSLHHNPVHKKESVVQNFYSSVVVKCRNLKSLTMTTGCVLNDEVVDLGLLPPSITLLAIFTCSACLFPHRSRIVNSGSSICLPNLVGLDVDVSLQSFPIDLQSSPLLQHLRLYLYNGDSSDCLHQLLQKVPQLVTLAIRTSSDHNDKDFVELDCTNLPNLLQISLPCKTRVKNVHQSFELVSIGRWDNENPSDALFECPQNFARLTTLTIGGLGTVDPDETLTRISQIAPLLETLNVHVNPHRLRMNVFKNFPKLQKVQPCLCFNPFFWSSVPKNVSFLRSIQVWHFALWFGDGAQLYAAEDVKKMFAPMPAFKHIRLDGQFCSEMFLQAVPERVLATVDSLFLCPTVSAHRMISLAKQARYIIADFFCHFVDFSNCSRLIDLQLRDDIDKSGLSYIGLLKASLATIKSPIRSLTCFVQSEDRRNFGVFPTSLLSRFDSLRYFSADLRLEGDLNLLPSSLTELSMDFECHKPDQMQRVISFLAAKRTNSPLIKVGLFCDEQWMDWDSAAPQEGWILSSETFFGTLKKFVWSKQSTGKTADVVCK